MEAYRKCLSKDPKIRPILKNEIVLPTKKSDILMGLVGSIISQQLSTVVAKVIQQRFLDLYDKKPTAQMILDTPISKLRTVGLSQQKAQYIHNVAEFMIENKVTAGKLAKMTDDEAIDFLSQIKGVGRWTVEMLLMFSMGREDVFAVDDLGIQKAMIALFKLNDLPKKELRLQMIEFSRRWAPYRTFACLYLWKYLDSME